MVKIIPPQMDQWTELYTKEKKKYNSYNKKNKGKIQKFWKQN